MMESSTTDLYLRFPTMEEACGVAAASVLANDPSRQQTDPETGELIPFTVETLPPDGRLLVNLYDIVVVPAPLEETGEVDAEGNPVMQVKTGVYILGRWRGPAPVPDALLAYSVPFWGAVLG